MTVNYIKENFLRNITKKYHQIGIPLFFNVLTLQPYFIDTLDPRQFKFEKVSGPTTVVFKELIADEKQKKAMLHLVVAEEKLTQHLWVAIFPIEGRWCIAPALGQNFIPSQGVAEALQAVYQACQGS